MNLSELPHKRKEDLKHKSERYEYLRAIHTAMADVLFDQYVISIAFPHTMASGGYVEAHDTYFCLETCFDDSGNAAHQIFYVPEANTWYEDLKEQRCTTVRDKGTTTLIVYDA